MSTEVESLELKIASDSKSAVAGIEALTQSLEKLKSATSGLSSVAKGIGKVSDAANKSAKSSKNTANANKELTKSFTDLFYKVKVGAKAFNVVRTKIWSAIKKSNDYIENVNLFSVSMGEYASEAMEYAETVSDAMGIDTSEWIRNQGVFMTLTTGFGVAGDRAKTMSKNLTQLGYDLSSFYNISVADAMQKLQSGMSGEIEPLRRLGYDLSQAKLEATALELGITKSVSAMTQAEKAQLRYHAILTQVTVTHGDMARTLDDPANQLRVLKSQVNMAAREIGNIFIPALNAVLPYLIAVTKVVRSLANTIAGLFGYEMPEIGNAASQVVTNTDAVTENLKDSQEEAKKLKSYMLGFDELNVINPNTESGSGAEDPLGEFDFELPEYDFMAGLVESKVATIVEEMKEWLGITDEIDSWSELLDTRLGHILKVVGLIGAGILAWRVTKTFIDSITALKLLLSNPSYTIAISAILTITGLTISFDGMESAIEDGLDGFNFAEIVGGGLLSAGGAAVLGAKIVSWMAMAFGDKVVYALGTMAWNLGVNTFGALGAAIGASVVGIIVGIPAFFVGIYDACKEGIDWLSSTLIGLGATAAGASIGAIIGMLGGPIGAGIGALIGLAIGLITDFTIWFWQKFDAIEAWFNGLPGWGKAIFVALAVVVTSAMSTTIAPIVGIITLVKKWDEIVPWVKQNVIHPVVGFFKGMWASVSGFFKSLWDDVVGVWNAVSSWFSKKVIDPIVSFFEGATLRIGQFFEGCWLIVSAIWYIASTLFDEHVIQPIVANFEYCKEQIVNCFTWAWKRVTEKWNKFASRVNETVITPVVNNFNWCRDKIVGAFNWAWDRVTETWNAFSALVDTNIIQPVKNNFQFCCEAIAGFFSWAWTGIKRGAIGMANSVIGGIESMINGIIKMINGLIGGFNKIVQWAADILDEDWGGVTLIGEVKFNRTAMPTFAEGGFPEQGQMFIAREAGAEMVGNIGRRTAVANNDQIVAGIAGGVAEANEEQNTLLREQNSLLRAILEKDSATYLDGRNLTNSVEKYQRERGRVLITGGVL